MAFQPAAGIAKAELRGSLFGQQIENVLHFKFNSAITGTAIEALAAALDDWMVSNYIALMPAEYLYRETYVKDLTTAFSSEWTSYVNAGDAGTLDAAMPGNVAWAVKFNTGSSGRSYRGRAYVPCTRANVDDNVVLLSFATNWVAGFAALITALASDAPDWTWVVLSRVTGGVPRPDGVGTPITTIGWSDLNVDSQRRRLNGRGR